MRERERKRETDSVQESARARVGAEGEGEGENLKQAPRPVRSSMWGSNHDPEIKNQMLKQLRHPGASM